MLSCLSRLHQFRTLIFVDVPVIEECVLLGSLWRQNVERGAIFQRRWRLFGRLVLRPALGQTAQRLLVLDQMGTFLG